MHITALLHSASSTFVFGGAIDVLYRIREVQQRNTIAVFLCDTLSHANVLCSTMWYIAQIWNYYAAKLRTHKFVSEWTKVKKKILEIFGETVADAGSNFRSKLKMRKTCRKYAKCAEYALLSILEIIWEVRQTLWMKTIKSPIGAMSNTLQISLLGDVRPCVRTREKERAIGRSEECGFVTFFCKSTVDVWLKVKLFVACYQRCHFCLLFGT